MQDLTLFLTLFPYSPIPLFPTLIPRALLVHDRSSNTKRYKYEEFHENLGLFLCLRTACGVWRRGQSWGGG